MIQHFIFDRGNVLIDFNPDYILSNYTDDLELIQILKQAIFANPIWKALDNGDISFEEGKDRIAQTIDAQYIPIVDTILDTWHTHKKPRLDMLELVKDLKKRGFGLYVCSNAAARFHEYKNNFEVFQYFDNIHISADIQISKPDQRFFEYVLAENGLEAKTCLFIDDSLENVAVAQGLGMLAYHFNGNTEMFEAYLKNVHIL